MIINGDLILDSSLIESLGNLREVRGELSLFDCRLLKNLGNLEKVEAKSIRYCRGLETFGKVKEIISKEVFDSWHFQIFENIKSLGKLKKVDCSMDITLDILHSKLISLNPIEFIGGDLKIGGYEKQKKSNFYDISSIKQIEGHLDLYYYPNEVLKINSELKIIGNIFVNSYTNKNCLSGIPKHLKNKITDKFEFNRGLR